MISDILCMPCAHIIDKINTLHLKYIAPNKIRNSKTKIILERFRKILINNMPNINRCTHRKYNYCIL